MTAAQRAARCDRVASRAEWALLAALWAAVAALAADDGLLPGPLLWLLPAAWVIGIPLVLVRLLAGDLADRYRQAAEEARP